MELPRTLLPWQQALSIFPKDLAIALGGIIDRLALLVGPMVSPDGAGRNDPDGLDGIGRRGSFERLLTTEWALAEEAPLEFLRRVSTGELSFLQIAHRKPTVARKCIALFDVGPDQRGGPRIVQLALLILLAQRAQAGNASFSWGVLQDAPMQLLVDVNKESVRQLIKGGSQKRPDILDAIDFRELFQGDTEVWFIGGPELNDLLPELNPYRVLIEDSFDPDAPNQLDVTVRHESGKAKSASVVLPAGNAAVRLLRDPFEVARAKSHKSRVRIAHDTNIVLSRDYRKIFLRGTDGELVTIAVPNSPNCTDPPKPRIFRPPAGETLAAVGRLMSTRTIAAVTVATDVVFIHELSPRGCTSVSVKPYKWRTFSNSDHVIYTPPWIEDPASPTRLGQLIQLQTRGEYMVYDGREILFQTHNDWFQIARTRIQNLTHDNGVLHFMHTPGVHTWIRQSDLNTDARPLPSDIREMRVGPGDMIAARVSDTLWQIFNNQVISRGTRYIPALFSVLGVSDLKDYLFYVLCDERKRIMCIDQEKTETCFVAPAPIKAIQASPTCWLITFITEDDELFVYSRDHKTLVLRMHLGET